MAFSRARDFFNKPYSLYSLGQGTALLKAALLKVFAKANITS